MIISPGRSYVFVHIPKTGGTSLAAALEGRAMKDDILIGDTPKAIRRRKRLAALKPRGRLWKHATLADIEGVLSGRELGEMFTFTLVRNPWDRVVSYYHWLQNQQFKHPDVDRAQKLNFEQFLNEPSVLRRLSRSPARHYMTDALGYETCNAYIRLEHFEHDAIPLFQHLGFRIALPHANSSARYSDFRRYYSPASHDAVAQACAEDVARFAYRFE